MKHAVNAAAVKHAELAHKKRASEKMEAKYRNDKRVMNAQISAAKSAAASAVKKAKATIKAKKKATDGKETANAKETVRIPK